MPPNGDDFFLRVLILFSTVVVTGIIASWSLLIFRVIQGTMILPREPARVVPWGAMSVVGVILLYFACQTFTVGTYVLFFKPIGAKGVNFPLRDQLLLSVAMNLAIAILLPLALKASSDAKPSDLGLTTRDLRHNLTRGILACLALLPLVYGVLALALLKWKPTGHPIEKMITADPSPMIALIAYTSAVIAAPLAEELLFRGILLASIWKMGIVSRRKSEEKWRAETMPVAESIHPIVNPEYTTDLIGTGPTKDDGLDPVWMWASNVFVSVIFAGMHFEQWPAPIPLFVLSLGLGFVYRRTRSLLAPIALHATFNALSTTVMFLQASSKMAPHAG